MVKKNEVFGEFQYAPAGTCGLSPRYAIEPEAKLIAGAKNEVFGLDVYAPPGPLCFIAR